MPNNHRLVIMRHAKSSWKERLPDHDRPLNKRGHRDGRAAGQWLSEHVGTLDRVLSSTSTRTRLTWQRAQKGGAAAEELTFHQELYGQGTEAYVQLLQSLPEKVGTAMVLGHWPDVEELTRALAPHDDHLGWEEMERKFPTSAIALLEVPVPWADLDRQVARLIDYAVPRG